MCTRDWWFHETLLQPWLFGVDFQITRLRVVLAVINPCSVAALTAQPQWYEQPKQSHTWIMMKCYVLELLDCLGEMSRGSRYRTQLHCMRIRRGRIESIW